MPSWIGTTGAWKPIPEDNLFRVRAAVLQVMHTAADFARALWYQRAQDLGIRATGAYLQGIQDAELRLVSETVSADELEIVYELVNHSPHAAIVEHGHPAFHLPDKIDWSAVGGSVKRGKSGPYLHIPFRHAAYQSEAGRERSGMTRQTLKTMMPSEVYAQAKKLSAVVPQKVGPIYRGEPKQFVAADRYSKGGRLVDNTPGPRFVSGSGGTVDRWRSERMVLGRSEGGARLVNPAWKTARFQGLFKSGTKGHTKYLTIRTVTPHSTGWNIPARQGTGCARQVAAALNGGPGHQRFVDLLAQAAVAAMRAA